MGSMASLRTNVLVIAALVMILMAAALLLRGNSRSGDNELNGVGNVVEKQPLRDQVACTLPSEGYKAWKIGLVTGLGSPIIKNCSKIISGDIAESSRAQRLQKNWMSTYKEQYYSKGADKSLLKQSSKCSWLQETMSNNLYNTNLEIDFPLAYIFLVYESPLQFLRLFKILYKPQNTYCIHVDVKSPKREFFNNIVRCFDNVIMASKLTDVRWSVYTMLDAQVQCFTDLVNLREKQEEDRKWKYVINLCSKELPLHTTKEMVQMLQSMKGTSSIVAWPIPKKEWWTIRRLREQPIPFNLSFYKSMAYNALSAPFATFMVKDPRAQELYQFFRKTDFPEEHFYPVLFHMPDIPGGYNPQIPLEDYFEVGHYFWRTNAAEVALPCYGETVHGICIVTHSDFPRIMRETKNGKTALFQNKYFMELNHVAMDCMEEMIVTKNKRDYEIDCKK